MAPHSGHILGDFRDWRKGSAIRLSPPGPSLELLLVPQLRADRTDEPVAHAVGLKPYAVSYAQFLLDLIHTRFGLAPVLSPPPKRF